MPTTRTFNAADFTYDNLLSRSSFSYAAALLSRGRVYTDCARTFWHRPLSRWHYLLADDTPALAAWLRLQEEQWAAVWRG